MDCTCRNGSVFLTSPTQSRTLWCPLHAKKSRDQVKLNPQHYDAHLHAEEGEDRVNLPPERHVDHLHAEGTDNVQLNPEHHGNQ